MKLARLLIVPLLLGSLAFPAQAAPGDGAEPTKPRHNLYEWMAIAPVVVIASLQGDDPRTPQMNVLHLVRGPVSVEGVVEVNVRLANNEREEFQPKLKLDPESYYVLLLDPPNQPKKDDTYHLVRGIKGARPVPKEGWQLYADALTRFAEIQLLDSYTLKWLAFEGLLEETNPLMILTALQQFLKFRKGTPDTALFLRPLMDHPRDDLRVLAVELIGLILVRHTEIPIDDRDELESELIALARRDASVEVRSAATTALGGVLSAPVGEILEEISRTDPEQEVRYAAERLLYEMELEPAAGG